jgi:two-component system sensor histidine kinase YesM
MLVSGYIVQQMRTSEMKHTVQMVRQVENSVNVYIGTIEKLVNLISNDLMSADVSEHELSRTLKGIADTHKELAGIFIAFSDDRFVSTGIARTSRDPFVNETWYQKAAQSPNSIVLLSSAAGRNVTTSQNYSIDDVFSLCKAFTDSDGRILGVLLLDVRHDIIRDSISSITIGEKGFIFVIDSEDNMVYTPANRVVYRVSPEWLSERKIPKNVNIRGEQYQIYYEKSPYTSWKTVGVFSVDEVMESVNTFSIILAVSIALSLAVVLVVSIVLATTVTTPILQLKQLMTQAELGNFTYRYKSECKDEIGELGNSYNRMLDKVDLLIKRVYAEQQSKKNAELKILQEQIKPHFLYNTLDTISWLARDHGARDIVRIVDALTNMYRVGLSSGKDYITVRDEISHISNYLFIQKIRYKDKLSYRIAVDSKHMDCLVPRLILQPIVENAIYHGIKQKHGGGKIEITLDRSGGKLVFCVKDDGAGIAPDKLKELRERLSTSDGKGSFGLFYVQERIYLCYGEGYGITVDSDGSGASVCITLPAGEARGERHV